MATEPCEQCGGKVLTYSHGCPVCAAPICCLRCCDETTQALKDFNQNYRERASAPEEASNG